MTLELPEDPYDGQVFELPENSADNFSGVLAIYKNSMCIGYTEKLDKIANISGMTELGRTVLSERLPKDTIITVQFEILPIQALVFVNFFGWQAHQYRKEITIDWQKTFKVLHTVEIQNRQGPQILYEKICVEKTKETLK